MTQQVWSCSSTHEASSSSFSSSSSSFPRRKYDVFLSFYGKDTRNNFVDHLFTALVREGITTFKDDEELEKGNDFPTELMDTIESSSFAIIIFSENYAYSSWCLIELVKILESKKNGQTILPIFYKVEPSDVRHQKKTFAKAFAKHEKNSKEKGKVQLWKATLKKVANLSGWDHLNVANG